VSSADLDATVFEPRGEASADGTSGPDEALAGVPEQLGRFRVIEPLGEGGMGVVYLAEDPDLGRHVAIKLLHERTAIHSQGRARLEREARTLAALSHPNVVHVYEIGAHDAHVYVAMEHVRGRSLRRWLQERERPWQDIVEMFCAAGEGLAAAHRAGIVHRDFKPDNVLVDPDGRPRVLDFGLAAQAMEPQPTAEGEAIDLDGLTATGTVMGTPVYMAPEQHTGAPPDARSDQFSFCVALYEALFGVRPFHGDTLERLREAVLFGRITPPLGRRSIPRRVVAVVRRGLAVRPEDRHASMTDLLAELRAAAARGWQRPVLAIAAGVAVLAAVVGLVTPGRTTSTDAPVPAAVATVAVPAVPWRITMRPLTKTSAPGVAAASIDRTGSQLVYSTGRDTWRRPIDGGTPTPVELPGGGYAWWLGGASVSGEMFVLVDGKLWRSRGARDSDVVVPELAPGTQLAVTRDGTRVATLRDEHLSIRELQGGAVTTLELPHERVHGIAWSPDGTRLGARTVTSRGHEVVRIVDPDGHVLAILESPYERVVGLAWVDDAHLVAPTGTMTAFGLRCLAYDDATRAVTETQRSETLAHPAAQLVLAEAADDGALLVTMARQIRDVGIAPIAPGGPPLRRLSPEIEAEYRGPAWIDEGTIATYSERDLRPTAAIHDIESGTVSTLDRLAAPLRRIAVARDRTIVAIVDPHDSERAAVVVLPDGGAPVVVPDSDVVARGARDLRCDAGMRCVILSEVDGTLRFHSLDLPEPRLVARAECSPLHGCGEGTWAPSADGLEILLPTRDYQRLEWIDLDSGELVGHAPAAPEGYEVGSAAPLPGTDEVIATLTLDASSQAILPTYVLARLSPTEPPRTLWTSEAVYLRRPVASPDGTRVAIDVAAFHTEAMLVEGAAGCRAR